MASIADSPLNLVAPPAIADVTAIEAACYRTQAACDELRADLDRLAMEIDRLLRERTHIREVLTTFYRSDITMSSLQPVLDLCVAVNPALKEQTVRS